MSTTTATADLDRKEAELARILREAGRVGVAYSGGLDSSLLLHTACRVLGAGNVLAVLGDSETLPAAERDEAVARAQAWGVTVRIIRTDELTDPQFAENPPDRCYHCKRHLFAAVRAETAAALGPGAVLLDGTNADDLGDYRPGRRAAAEAGVRSPLLEAGLGKDEVRELSRRHGLATAERPPGACLASRVPYGTRLTEPLLAQVAAAEAVLHAAGFPWVRVRHHGPIARVEVPPADLARVVAIAPQLVAQLQAAGYRYVTLDLAGYRTGSLNEMLPCVTVPGPRH